VINQNTKTQAKLLMVIEDDPLLTKMYKTKIASEGFRVITAQDGQEGLKKALEYKPDGIILDVMMPKLSGIDMLTRLRQDAYGKNIPVVIISNLSQEAEDGKAKELGVKEYLIKANYTPKEVIERLKQYI